MKKLIIKQLKAWLNRLEAPVEDVESDFVIVTAQETIRAFEYGNALFTPGYWARFVLDRLLEKLVSERLITITTIKGASSSPNLINADPIKVATRITVKRPKDSF